MRTWSDPGVTDPPGSGWAFFFRESDPLGVTKLRYVPNRNALDICFAHFFLHFLHLPPTWRHKIGSWTNMGPKNHQNMAARVPKMIRNVCWIHKQCYFTITLHFDQKIIFHDKEAQKRFS